MGRPGDRLVPGDASGATAPSAPPRSSARATGSSSRAGSGPASTTRKDGTKRTSLEITADNVIALERQGRDDGDGEFAAAAPAGAPAEPPAARRRRRRRRRHGGGGRGGFDDTELDDLPF